MTMHDQPTRVTRLGALAMCFVALTSPAGTAQNLAPRAHLVRLANEPDDATAAMARRLDFVATRGDAADRDAMARATSDAARVQIFVATATRVLDRRMRADAFANADARRRNLGLARFAQQREQDIRNFVEAQLGAAAGVEVTQAAPHRRTQITLSAVRDWLAQQEWNAIPVLFAVSAKSGRPGALILPPSKPREVGADDASDRANMREQCEAHKAVMVQMLTDGITYLGGESASPTLYSWLESAGEPAAGASVMLPPKMRSRRQDRRLTRMANRVALALGPSAAANYLSQSAEERRQLSDLAALSELAYPIIVLAAPGVAVHR